MFDNKMQTFSLEWNIVFKKHYLWGFMIHPFNSLQSSTESVLFRRLNKTFSVHPPRLCCNPHLIKMLRNLAMSLITSPPKIVVVRTSLRQIKLLWNLKPNLWVVCYFVPCSCEYFMSVVYIFVHNVLSVLL